MRLHRLFFGLIVAIAFIFSPWNSRASPQATDSNSVPALMAQVIDGQVTNDSIEASTTILVPLSREILRVARRERLPPALLAAFIQEESGFNPWAGRTEPGYLKKTTIITQARQWSKQHKGIPTALTELSDRSRSFGPMQVMGQVAREQGYDSMYLASLYSPFNSISEGAKLLKKKLAAYPGDTLSAISAYNQGNNRKKHGTFQNARYVFRVSTAWEAYEQLFAKKKSQRKVTNESLNEPQHETRNQDSDSISDCSGAPGGFTDDLIHPDTADTAAAHSTGTTIHRQSDPRHDVAAPTESVSASERALDRDAVNTAYGFAIVGLLGLGAFIFDRHLRNRERLTPSMLRHPKGLVQRKSPPRGPSAHAV